MANTGKLGKIKCMIRRWHSSGRAHRSGDHSSPENGALHSASFHGDKIPAGMHPVYVGKSRRRYLVGCEVIENPLFRVLVERSGGGDDEGGTVVGCEVVMFEHLLWMLENAEPKPESLEELIDFYA